MTLDDEGCKNYFAKVGVDVPPNPLRTHPQFDKIYLPIGLGYLELGS